MDFPESRRTRARAVAFSSLLEARRSQQRGAHLGRGTCPAICRHGAAHLGAVLYSSPAEGAARIHRRRALSARAQSALHWQFAHLRERNLLRKTPLARSFYAAVVLRCLFGGCPI